MRLQDRSVGHHQAAKLRLKAKPRSLSATSSGSQRSMISSANSADAFPGPAASAALFRFRKRWVAKKGRTSPGVARCGPSIRNAASYSQNETGATGGAHLGSRADRSDANIATSGGTSSSDLHLMISSANSVDTSRAVPFGMSTSSTCTAPVYSPRISRIRTVSQAQNKWGFPRRERAVVTRLS